MMMMHQRMMRGRKRGARLSSHPISSEHFKHSLAVVVSITCVDALLPHPPFIHLNQVTAPFFKSINLIVSAGRN